MAMIDGLSLMAMWVFFHEHSGSIGLQGKGGGGTFQ